MRGSAGSVRVIHKEYVGSATTINMASPETFMLLGRADGYDINPGSASLFPWLAPMALNFERFRFNSLRFKATTACSVTSASGRIYLTVDYDWDDPIPHNKREFVNNQYTVSGPLTKDLTLSTSPRLLHADMPWKYVKSPTRADPEPRTNYCGFLLAAADAVGSSVAIDLWVEYDVTLSTPQFDSVDPEFLSRPEYNTSLATTPTVPAGSHIFQVPLPTSGVNFVRAMVPNAPTHAGVVLKDAIDIRKVNAGSLLINTRLSETGVTPASIFGKMNANTTVNVYDALGTLITNINANPRSGRDGVESVVAADDPAAVSNPGAGVTWLVTVLPGLIKAVHATAAFLHVFNIAASQIGPSKVSCDLTGLLRSL